MTMAEALAVTEFAEVVVPFRREDYRRYNADFVCLRIGERYAPSFAINGAELIGVWTVWN